VDLARTRPDAGQQPYGALAGVQDQDELVTVEPGGERDRVW
jgi:hypothetical protein